MKFPVYAKSTAHCNAVIMFTKINYGEVIVVDDKNRWPLGTIGYWNDCNDEAVWTIISKEDSPELFI
jgi:hypothetical protein